MAALTGFRDLPIMPESLEWKMLESLNGNILEVISETEKDYREKDNVFELLGNKVQVDLPIKIDNQLIHGVIVGKLTGFDESNSPLVTFGENNTDDPRPARSVVALNNAGIGREVVLMFESGNPQKPIVMGVIESVADKRSDNSLSVKIDGERVVLMAEKEIVLRCGEASITLTKAGKVLIRGAYLSSRSSGVNRIKGGSVQIN